MSEQEEGKEYLALIMQMPEDQIIELLANLYGKTVDEIKKNIPPDFEFDTMRGLAFNVEKYQLVAECVSVDYCGAGLQVGDVYVVNEGMVLDLEKTTAPVCMGAMQELMARSFVFFDRTRRVAEPEEITRAITGMKCFDPGWELGGAGHANFKVRIERIGD